MTRSNGMTRTLAALVEELIADSPFFRFWKEGSVTSTVSREFLLSFDFLVASFPSLIAAGAARMVDEESRIVLALNLYQESGEGDRRRTHHAIYRKFLETAGFQAPSLGTENPFAAEWREKLSKYILGTEDAGAALGALAAGEFLAQPALTRIYSVLRAHYPSADQEYFTKHLQLEVEHVREIFTIMEKQAKRDGGWGGVLAGFRFGLSVWEGYFRGLSQFLEGLAIQDPFLIRTGEGASRGGNPTSRSR